MGGGGGGATSGGPGKGGMKTAIASPLAFLSKGKLKEFDPVGVSAAQAWQNTEDVISGKQEFGVHENIFGDTRVGDYLNPIFGGKNIQQREEKRDNEKLWEEYFARKGKPKPKARGGWNEYLEDLKKKNKAKKKGRGLKKQTHIKSLLDEDEGGL